MKIIKTKEDLYIVNQGHGYIQELLPNNGVATTWDAEKAQKFQKHEAQFLVTALSQLYEQNWEIEKNAREKAKERRKLREKEKRFPAQSKKQDEGFLYFIECVEEKSVKIGFTANLTKRFQSIRNNKLPNNVKLLGYVKGTRKSESILHDMFSRYRSHGEWFHLEEEIIQWIKVFCYETN